MLGDTIVGIWQIEGQDSSLRLLLSKDQKWRLRSNTGQLMGGTWKATADTLELRITKYGQVTFRRAARATSALIVGMVRGLATGLAAIMVPGPDKPIVPMLGQSQPPVLGTFTQDQVRKGEAYARFVLVSEAANRVVLRNARETKVHNTTITLNRGS